MFASFLNVFMAFLSRPPPGAPHPIGDKGDKTEHHPSAGGGVDGGARIPMDRARKTGQLRRPGAAAPAQRRPPGHRVPIKE